jgi:hypothetical protein
VLLYTRFSEKARRVLTFRKDSLSRSAAPPYSCDTLEGFPNVNHLRKGKDHFGLPFYFHHACDSLNTNAVS